MKWVGWAVLFVFGCIGRPVAGVLRLVLFLAYFLLIPAAYGAYLQGDTLAACVMVVIIGAVAQIRTLLIRI